jgi:formylglycine-generating enzyme required for sulfatase activity
VSLRVFRAGIAAAVVAGLATAATMALSPQPPGTATSPIGEHSQCAAYDGLPSGWGHDTHAGMIHITAGSFVLGSDRGYAEERPTAERRIDSFWIDRTEVTNAQFASFVAATGYVTEAERNDGAAVFIAPSLDHTPSVGGAWWHLLKDASWRHPDGSGSGIAGRGHDPVVDVSYADALAYAHWLGRDLPNEAEWEYAAKARLDNAAADATVRDAQGHWLANVWQGFFPFNDSGEDGFSGRAPVGCYPANGWGLHDMVGNVWEWTRDPWQDRHTAAAAGSSLPASADRRVIKGGSFLCSANYCTRARASSRQGQEASLPTSHIGFRTILRG